MNHFFAIRAPRGGSREKTKNDTEISTISVWPHLPEVISSPHRSARNSNAPSRHRIFSCASTQGLQQGAKIGRRFQQMAMLHAFQNHTGKRPTSCPPGKTTAAHHKTTPSSPNRIAACTSMQGLPRDDREKTGIDERAMLRGSQKNRVAGTAAGHQASK